MIEKFITKDNVIIAVVVFCMVIGFFWQSKYFATQLDLANLRNEMLQMKVEMQKYSDDADKQILNELDIKYDKIMNKLDKLR